MTVDVDPGTRALVRSLARRINDLEAGRFRSARASQAAYRSIEAGGQKVYDEVGNLRTIVGAQEDGTYSVQVYGGDPPPIPSAPIVTLGSGAVTITWDGYDDNDELGWPADFDRVEVHVSDSPGIVPDDLNQVASFNSPIGGSTTLVLGPGEELYVVFTSANKAGIESAPSYEVHVTGSPIEEDPGPDPGTGGPGNPGIPSVSSRLGVIRVDWAGTTDKNHAYLEVHVSTNPAFVPVKGNPATLVETLYGRAPNFAMYVASGSYGVTYYFRFLAVDKWGNPTVGGVSPGISIQPLVNTDVIGQVIAGANIVSGTVNAADKIIGNTITGALIQALAIQTGNLAANAVTTEKLAVGSVTAEKIQVGAVTADKLSATAIDGKTITGAYIQTAYSGSRVVLSSSGLLVTGNGRSQDTYIWPGGDVWVGGELIVWGGAATFTQGLQLGGQLQGNGYAGRFGQVYVTAPESGSAIPNTRFVSGSAGGQLIYTDHANSSRRFKKNIRDIDLDPATAYAVRPVEYEWRDRFRSPDRPSGYVDMGFVAEELQALGLDRWLGFDDRGRPSEVDYAKMSVVNQVAIRDLHRRLTRLEESQ